MKKKNRLDGKGEPTGEEIMSAIDCCSSDVTKSLNGVVRETAGNARQRVESSMPDRKVLDMRELTRCNSSEEKPGKAFYYVINHPNSMGRMIIVLFLKVILWAGGLGWPSSVLFPAGLLWAHSCVYSQCQVKKVGNLRRSHGWESWS